MAGVTRSSLRKIAIYRWFFSPWQPNAQYQRYLVEQVLQERRFPCQPLVLKGASLEYFAATPTLPLPTSWHGLGPTYGSGDETEGWVVFMGNGV